MVACAAISAEVAGLPVCAATEFLLSFIDSHSDWSQNSPSSQAGEWHAALDDRGLGGNINTVALQFYDPFNLPSVTIYESSGCTGSSTTFGIRNYTFFGGSDNPQVNITNDTTWSDISYPALNGNSVFLPYYTQMELYDSDGTLV